MTREKVDLVKQAIAAFDARDIESLAPLMTEDHEWFGAFLGRVEGGSYRGREGMERYFAEADTTWRSFRSNVTTFHDLGDKVLSVGRLEGEGKTSGVAVDTPFAMVSEFRGGKLSRTHAYPSEDEAREAAAAG